MRSSEIVCREQRIRLQCGERFIRSWDAPENALVSGSRRIALGLIHGLGDHSGRFDEMARWFAARGLHVYALDLIGHGNSPGARMAIPDYESLLQEVESLLDYVKQQHPDLPIGLFGQSKGGNLVLNHQLRGYSQPAFVIAGSPMLRAVDQPAAAQLFLIRVLSRLYPQYQLGGELDPSNLSRDTEMQRAFQKDPLVQRGITARVARVLIDSGRWAIQSAHRISAPTLLAHGSDDRITCHEASLEFAEKSLGKATTMIWPGGKHDLHHDIVREEYFASLFEWIGRAAGKPS